MCVLSLKHISHLQVFGSLIWKRHSHLQYEWISSVPRIPTLDPSIMALLLFHWYTCMHFYSPGKYQAWFCYYDSMLLLSPKLSFVFYIIQELNTNGYNIRNKEQNSGYFFFCLERPDQCSLLCLFGSSESILRVFVKGMFSFYILAVLWKKERNDLQRFTEDLGIAKSLYIDLVLMPKILRIMPQQIQASSKSLKVLNYSFVNSASLKSFSWDLFITLDIALDL